MQYMLIRNARLTTATEPQENMNVLVADGRVVCIGPNIQQPLANTEDFDAKGLILMPALIDIALPLTANTSDDHIKQVNFEKATSGVATVLTVANDIDENIIEMTSLGSRAINRAYHFPLRQLSLSDNRTITKTMILHGIATAIVRFGDERRTDVASLASSIAAARSLGIRVVYDLRGVVDIKERISIVSNLCKILPQSASNKAYVIGVEYEEELGLLWKVRSQFDLCVHLSYDPFGQATPEMLKLSANTIVEELRQNKKCSLGLAYSDSRASREGWPDMTPDIVSRNYLPILAGMPADKPLSAHELMDFAICRIANFMGLTPNLGTISEGSDANFIVWNPNEDDFANLDTPRGNIQNVPLKGRVESTIINGHVVADEKFHEEAVHGKHIYARIV